MASRQAPRALQLQAHRNYLQRLHRLVEQRLRSSIVISRFNFILPINRKALCDNPSKGHDSSRQSVWQ